MKLVGYTSSLSQCSVFYVFGTMDEPISRRLAQDFSFPLITTLQQECKRAFCPEMKVGEWLYFCVANGNDGAMEVCFVLNTTSIIDLTSYFSQEALLRYRLHLHTVDIVTVLLYSPRTFPSRYDTAIFSVY